MFLPSSLFARAGAFTTRVSRISPRHLKRGCRGYRVSHRTRSLASRAGFPRATMGKNKTKTKKFAETKRILNPKEARVDKSGQKRKKKRDDAPDVKHVEATSSSLFFKHNSALGPPYSVLVDTNFINFSIKNKIDLVKGMMDCLYAQCVPHVTDCVMAELEKLGQKYRVALRVAKDPRFVRLPCTHPGTYADDCICERVRQHKCYVVATCDTDLKRRLRKIPGVPIMYLQQHRDTVERLPEAVIGNPKG